MPTGTVKWFDATKGYGFIAPEDGSKDVFVHVSAVERAGLGTLREEQRLTRPRSDPDATDARPPRSSPRPSRRVRPITRIARSEAGRDFVAGDIHEGFEKLEAALAEPSRGSFRPLPNDALSASATGHAGDLAGPSCCRATRARLTGTRAGSRAGDESLRPPCTGPSAWSRWNRPRWSQACTSN